MKRSLAVMLALIFALAALLTGCAGEGGKKNADEYAVKDDLLKSARADEGHNRVFYEIFVGSFSDSDGDGTGDIRGIINRMDYLNDGDPDSGLSLGVEGLWLTPIFKSSSYHKYNVTDYYQVDPAFGTEEDLKELIALCHERDVLLILDLPINHTARACEWFNKFIIAHRQGDTASEYYNFYTWYDGDAGGAPAGRTFAQLSGTNHYFECNFDGDMPELDFDQENVRQAVVDVAKHYLDMGVDGFRFDAAKYVYFGDHKRSVEFWKWYMGKLRDIKPDVYAVAEVWDSDGVTDQYYPAMNCFDFTISQSNGLIAETAKKGDVNRYTAYVESYISRVDSIRPGSSFTPFVTNHDMDRAAGFLTVASGTMHMAANLYVLGPGTPFIYYGEEIGMRGSRGGAQTDANRRLAMLWGDGDYVKDPTGTTYPASSQVETTVVDQKKDENSLYNHYKKLIMIRNANPEIATGHYIALSFEGTKVGGFVAYDTTRSSVIVIHNTTLNKQTIDLDANGLTAEELRAVIGMESAELDGSTLTIGGQTSVVLKGGLKPGNN